jgi:glycosyltransferase involved in cell wall biosynthesis
MSGGSLGTQRREHDSVRQKRIGLYLGVQPNAGGMFQYAQCILKSLAHLQQSGEMEVIAAYGDSRWASIISPFALTSVSLRHVILGRVMARVMMSLFVPPWLARFLAGAFNPLAKELNALGCDLWLFPAQDELAWQVKRPVVASIHDLMHRYERGFPEAGSWWRSLIRDHRFRSLAHHSAAILVDSELGKRHVIESYAARPECVHPLPYIAPGYILDNRERADFDAFYQLPSKFYFYPAQFWPHKNHQRLIRALVQAKRSCPDIALVLAGGLRHGYEGIRQEVVNCGLEASVRFVGYVPDEDMAGFYKRARGLVMPTFFGPTNIPPLEAMALGCPVMISATYAMPEQCGPAALYFDPTSTEEISTQMARLWTDDQLCGQLSDNGRCRSQGWGERQFEQRLGLILKATVEKSAAAS